ncbi:MAG: DUF6090 family protein [Balneolaceae bacterium]|nr:DUF6090 family protein [Balneolaceae bacterium]
MQGKARTYILYAIGEILLVVIGILIALQVNNWNEERKKLNDIELLADEIEQALDQNRRALAIISDRGHELDSTLNVILSNEFDRLIMEKDPDIRKIFWAETFVNIDFSDFFRTESFKVALNREREFPNHYQSLLSNLRFIESVLNSMSKSNQLFNEFRDETGSYMLEHHPYLFLDDKESIERSFNYVLENPEFKARVSFYQDKVRTSIRTFDLLKTRNILGLSELYILNRNFTMDQIDSLWSDSGFNKFHAISCSEDMPPSVLSNWDKTTYIPFIHSREEPITVQVTSGEFKSPQTFESNTPGILYFNPGSVLEYTINGECRKIVVDHRHGYITLK